MTSRRGFIKNTSWALSAAALGISSKNTFASQDLVRLTVLHTNDIHCHIDPFPKNHPTFPGRGGMARLGGFVNQLRNENPNLLLLDAGDMFQGTPYFNFFKGELMIKVMNTIGYDVSTIGNHEFDNGLDDLDKALSFVKFPIVSSNYNFDDTILANRIDPFKILYREGIKIGIYGLGIELDRLVKKENYGGTYYLDPIETSQTIENSLKNEHQCELIICLSHLGYNYKENKVSDISIAKNTKNTDLIIGGHTHTFLEKPIEMPNANGQAVIINQVGWGALSIGKIGFIFDRSKKIKTIASNIIHV